jgi:hypothetical protein
MRQFETAVARAKYEGRKELTTQLLVKQLNK